MKKIIHFRGSKQELFCKSPENYTLKRAQFRSWFKVDRRNNSTKIIDLACCLMHDVCMNDTTKLKCMIWQKNNHSSRFSRDSVHMR
jgi:hypothetical protein